MNFKSRMLAIATLILAMTGTSFGIQQIQQVPFSNLSVPGTLTLNFDQFDPALGILQQVIMKVEVDPLTAGDAAYDNESPDLSNVTLSTEGEIRADTMMTTSPILVTLSTGEATGSALLDPDVAGEGAPDFAGPDALVVNGPSVSDSQQEMIDSNLNEYVGTGDFDVSVQTTAKFTVTIEGGFGQLQTDKGSADGNVTLTYVYIPEPASLAMLGFGSVVLLRRRRR